MERYFKILYISYL